MNMAGSLLKSPVLQKLKIACRLRVCCQGFSLSAQACNESVVVPPRIPRSPTDILQALASTVGSDMSGPHYKYQDDPYLTPASNLDKRSYSLSKESGRKSARWIQNEHSQLFSHNPEDPFIEAFFPKVTYTEESNVSEETLEELIQKSLVADAIQVYKICQSKGIELSDNIRQNLLEFVSYYNCEETLEEDFVEERWYRQGVMGRGGLRKTWKDNGVAEELFKSLGTKDSRAFCALIRGMASYFQIDRSWQLYQEAIDKDIPLDTETFNCMIRVSPFLREGSELRWQLVKDLLKTMAEKGVSPNLGTLNCTLEALVQVAGWRQTRDLSLQVLSEFSSIGIQPSLATYYYLLLIHCRERGPISTVLINIMDHIEGKEFQIQDMKDTFFFVTAMDVCCNHIKSLEVAHRVNRLLHTGSNYCLIGDSFKESIYHRHFFTLACSGETADAFMELYNDMVPHVYTPEPRVMAEIVTSLKVHDALGYLPQIWSDMIVFDHATQEKLVTEVLSCSASHVPSAENSELTKQISAIVWDIWTRVQAQDESRRNKVTWSGQMISDVLTTLVQCDSYDKALQVFGEILDKPHDFLGSASIESLRLLSSAALDKEDSTVAVNVVTYAADVGHQEAAELAKEAVSKLKLSSQQRTKLTSALGVDIMDS